MTSYGELKYKRQREQIELGMLWLCGACGGVHEWDCPYTPGPEHEWTDTQVSSGLERMKRDKVSGTGAFTPEKLAKFYSKTD